MRIDQPEPGEPGDPGAPGDAGASERTARRGTETSQERTARHETKTPAEHTAQNETKTPAEHTAQNEMGAAPDAAAKQQAKAPASRAEQIAAHLRYRETVSVTTQAAADRAAWAEALPELRAAWAEHKEKYPDQADAEPRTEADGSWACGEHRRLDPEQNSEASKAHADLADEARLHILPALRRVEAADPERQLAGLEHMVKGEDRLKEKLADAMLAETHLTVGQALGKIPDVIRFTLTYSAERYTEGVLADVDRLKEEGFKLIKLRNEWQSDQYKGINSQWRRQGTDTRIEMQFHTPESLEAKELTHEAYERLRRPETETSQSERDKLEDFQRQVNAVIATPPYAETIENFTEKKR